MNRASIIGIDPGLNGGIGIIFPDGRINFSMMPITNHPTKMVDGLQLKLFLSRNFPVEIAFVEKLWGTPGWDSKSLFNYGTNYGVILGVLRALEVPIEVVAPKTWKKAVLGSPDASKDDSMSYCEQRWKRFFQLQSHDGMADAICIAVYGEMVDKGEI